MVAIAAPARIPLRPPAARSSDRLLQIALGISILIHGIVLSIQFKFPEAIRKHASSTLEVVLVNSKTARAPEKPEVLAQANLDGGGNTHENRRAKSPLPVMPRTRPGTDIVEQTQSRLQRLEQEQQQLLAQVKKSAFAVPDPPESRPEPTPVREAPQPEVQGADLATRAIAMARLEAQIARQVDEYAKRPRKTFVGARATEVRFAQYVEDWRQKIERIGNMNYPADARGRIYGSLRLTVAIRADGVVDSIEVNRPSGYKILDDAAQRIVKLGAPYAVFPPEVRRDTDILVITRTWIFGPGDKLHSE